MVHVHSLTPNRVHTACLPTHHSIHLSKASPAIQPGHLRWHPPFEENRLFSVITVSKIFDAWYQSCDICSVVAVLSHVIYTFPFVLHFFESSRFWTVSTTRRISAVVCNLEYCHNGATSAPRWIQYNPPIRLLVQVSSILSTEGVGRLQYRIQVEDMFESQLESPLHCGLLLRFVSSRFLPGLLWTTMD